MYVDSKSNASLELFMTLTNGTKQSLWKQNYPGRNKWEIADINVVPSGVDTRLVFEGKVHGAYGKSDIGT